MDGAEPSRQVGDERPAAAVVALAGGGVTFAAVFFGGTSGDGSVLWVGGAAVVFSAIAFVAAGLGLVAFPALDGPARLAVAAFAALVALSGMSIVWSIAGDESWSALNKGIAYLGFLVVGLALAALGTNATRLVASVLALVLGAALVWALAGKAIPALAANDASRVARLHSPVGYWNGLALLADAALALGLWLSLAAWARREVRAAGAGLVYVAVLAGLLTTSRAGVLGGLLALALWLILGPRRVESAAVTVLAGAPAIAVAAWTFTRPALVDVGRTHGARVHDGALFGIVALAGLAIAVAVPPLLVRRLVTGRERLVGRVLMAGALAALVLGIAAVWAVSGNPVTKAQRGFSRGECSNTADRLTCTNNNRLKWWREAVDIFAARPVGGAGAGTFAVARNRYRRSGASVTEPHSVPLQILAGTGVGGGLLLVLCVAGAGLALRRSLARLEGPERAAAVAVAALPLAYALHALVDYDIDFVAVSAPAAVATGALLGAGRPPVRPRAGIVPMLAGVAVAATAVASLVMPWLASRRVDATYTAAEAGRLRAAVADAGSARSLNPLSPEPLYALAYVYQAANEVQDARFEYTRATRLQPENPETWYRLGLFEYTQGHDLCAAYQALNHSYTLDPRNTHWFKGSELDVSRAAVNDKANPACGRG
jgi:tetratricopeptide (TPR) repeat protein